MNGTQYNVGFNGSKLSSNSQFATFNPSLSTRLSFGFTQPLLRDRGAGVVKLPITIARSRLRASEFNMRDQLMRLLVTSETVYWQVIQERESLQVAEEYLKLNDASLKRAQRSSNWGLCRPWRSTSRRRITPARRSRSPRRASA